VSCNPYFEEIGALLGYERIHRYARLLGLGAPTGLNLKDEAAGLLPRSIPESRVRIVSSHARGIATTPVQIAVLLSATLNGGIVLTPQLAP
jgi:penicillin-binding protein 2